MSAICHLSEWLFRPFSPPLLGFPLRVCVLECLTLSHSPRLLYRFYFRSFSCSGHFFTCLHVWWPSPQLRCPTDPTDSARGRPSFSLFMHFRVCYFLWALSLSFPSRCQNDHLVTYVVPITLIMAISFYYYLPHLGTCWGISVPQPGPKLHPCSEAHGFKRWTPGKSQLLQIPGQTVLAWAPYQSLVLRLALSLWNVCFSGLFHKPQIFQ